MFFVKKNIIHRFFKDLKGVSNFFKSVEKIQIPLFELSVVDFFYKSRRFYCFLLYLRQNVFIIILRLAFIVFEN